MTDATYTLTGFGGFLERRRIAFAEPLPAIRVCSICGLVPSSTKLLPCCHVVCDDPCGRQVEAAGSCPLDGRTVAASSVVPFKFEQSELEQLLVRCLNTAANCTFTGELSELEDHLLACECDAVECSKCGGRVLRNEAASHRKTCCDSATSVTWDGSGMNACLAVKDIARMKEDLEELCEFVSEEESVKDAIVNDVNFLAERAARLEVQLISVAKEIADLKCPSPASNAVFPHGPHRTASGRGSAITLYKLGQLQFEGGSVIKGEPCTLQGYTFYVSCSLNFDDLYDRTCEFEQTFCSGPWDDYVDWPFARRIRLIIAHLRDERKDIRLSTALQSQESRYYLKPQPGGYNVGMPFERVRKTEINEGNYTIGGNLYLNVEFMQ
ncbi:hypothetical protein HPB49_024707 [Dermacentor silvarum]|uniref:Uncharacterized protein n=1 Tax=Dermacentor silvarum TaxID=543639 RepID=A0ACB8DRV0_DERSI|nr:hypothetical protein HPB49_024707 [Dermacentor silvarum]